jgi:hypothetical protein
MLIKHLPSIKKREQVIKAKYKENMQREEE